MFHCFPAVSSALIHNHCNVKTSFRMLHLPTVINFSLSPRTHTRSFYLTSKSWKKVNSHKEYGSAITCCLSSQHWKSNWCMCWTMATFLTPCTSPAPSAPAQVSSFSQASPWTRGRFLINRLFSRWKRNNWVEEHLYTYLPAQIMNPLMTTRKEINALRGLEDHWQRSTDSAPPALPCSVIV